MIMTKVKVDELTIDGTVYVPKESIAKAVNKVDGMDYCLVRTFSAGVFCGWVKSREGKEVVILESIRLWRWSGAASLSQLAMEGVTNPFDCKFGVPITTETTVLEAIEIVIMTDIAKDSIQSVPSWRA